MMKRIILLSGLFFYLLTAYGQGIFFETGSFKQALAKAKQENKLVFADVFAEWCGPCKQMERTVFKEKAVGEYANEHFVSVQLNCERGEGISIKTRYATNTLPTFLFLDGEGNVVYRSGGGMKSEEFLGELQKAVAYASDPNNIGRLAARYKSEKNDEQFLRIYLDRLKELGAIDYYNVVEQYLKVQKSMASKSEAMVRFLYDHIACLVYGGEADRILQENLWTEDWDLYVRKGIREKFQKLPELLAKQTTEYAIQTRDTSLLEMSMKRAQEEGLKLAEGQREHLYTYYYLHTKQGEAYKQLVKPQIDAFANSLDMKRLQEGHRRFLEENKGKELGGSRSFAMRDSERLRMMATDYARFVETNEEKEILCNWASMVYQILPEDPLNMAFYAKVLYLRGDKVNGILMMENALRAGKTVKRMQGMDKDLETMKAGGDITF